MYKAAFTILCLLPAAVSCPAVARDEPPAEIHVVADSQEYEFETQSFRAKGNVSVTYADISLSADAVTGNAGTGNLEAAGQVEFRQGDRVLTGETFSYNYETGEGLALNAAAVVDELHFRGSELRVEESQYTISGSRFTTCDKPKPHYYLSARELSFIPGRKLTARGVSIYFFGSRILTVPKYSVRLGKHKEKRLALPRIGASKAYGVYAGYKFNLSHDPGTTGTLEVVMSTRQVFQGGFEYRSIRGKPIVANLTYRQPYRAGLRSDLLLSRLPEVGYGFSSPGARDRTGVSEQLDVTFRELVDAHLEAEKTDRLNYAARVTIGHFIEEPGHVRSGRLDLRGVVWPRPYDISENALVAPALFVRQSLYDAGKSYTDLGFRLAVTSKIGKDSYISTAYINHAIAGSTPFQFDPVEIRRELAARAAFAVADLKLELGGRFDMSDGSLFDSEISVAREMHCIEPRITWRNRFREISFELSILAL